MYTTAEIIFIDFQELKAVCIRNETKVARAARNNLLTFREGGPWLVERFRVSAVVAFWVGVSMNQVNGLEPSSIL